MQRIGLAGKAVQREELYGFQVEDLIARCKRNVGWVNVAKVRFLTTLISVVVVGFALWDGSGLGVAVAIAVGAVWWNISTRFIKARSEG